ncbi:MAG: hypothetical protein GWP21_06350 [Euryarchaeota archaeon]|nr:hypothetical protein [Euryarchaeota archaeon]
MTDVGDNVELPRDAVGQYIAEGEWIYSRYHSEDIQWNNANLHSTANRDADTFGIHVVGKHVEGASGNNGDVWSKISLAQSWIDTRSTTIDFDGSPTIDSSEMSSDPLANLFDEADAMDEVLDDLDIMNDQPPYHENLFFGNTLDIASLPASWGGSPFVETQNLQTVALAATQPGAGSISAVNSFSAICGLVQVEISHASSGDNKVELYLDIDTRGSKV